jgi:hypothetical protein
MTLLELDNDHPARNDDETVQVTPIPDIIGQAPAGLSKYQRATDGHGLALVACRGGWSSVRFT